MLNPNDFVITRKRKKYKFAKFSNSDICFEFDEWQNQPVDCIEVGAGTGLFSVELARMNPDKKFVALDVKGDRLQKGAYFAKEEGIPNIKFLRARADQLGDLFDKHSVENLWITFPDPFPKKRSQNRRLTSKNFLDTYKEIVKIDGNIHLKHDNPNFFCWSLEQFVKNRFNIVDLIFDINEEGSSGEFKTQTTYEKRWLEEGRKISYCRIKRR